MPVKNFGLKIDLDMTRKRKPRIPKAVKPKIIKPKVWVMQCKTYLCNWYGETVEKNCPCCGQQMKRI